MGAFTDATKRLEENLRKSEFLSDRYKDTGIREKIEQMKRRAVGADSGVKLDQLAWYDAESEMRRIIEHYASTSTFAGLFGEIGEMKKSGALSKPAAGGGASPAALQAKVLGEALAKGFRENRRSIAWIVLIISVALLVWILVDVLFGFVQTPFGTLVRNSLEQYIPINEFKTGLSNQMCILGCYATGITSVASWTAAGGLDKYCQLTCKTTAQAEQLGCTNCYALTPGLEEPTPIPLVSDTIKMSIGTPEGKRYSWGVGGTSVIVPIPPAQDPTVSVTSNDFVASINEQYMCANFDNSKPNICKISSPIGPYDVPVKLSADFKAPCKPSAQYSVTFTYTYNVTGLSFLKFAAKNYKGTIATPQPTSSPGPLSFNAEPYSDVYPTDATEARVTFSLINQGSATSRIKVNSITVNQVAPSGYSNLVLTDCIEATAKPTSGGSYELELTPSVQPGSENAVNFHCSFSLPSDLKQKLTQSAYYTILATAKYTYTDNVVGDTVYPDPRYRCTVSLKDWNMLPCIDSTGKPTNYNTGACNSPDSSGNAWNVYSFDDFQWNKVTLPDTSWGCTNCDRLYRLDNVIWDGTKDVWLNVSSEDAARCWVSNKNSAAPVPVTGCLPKTCVSGKDTIPCSQCTYVVGGSCLPGNFGCSCSAYSSGGGWGDLSSDDGTFYSANRTMSNPPYKCKIGDSSNVGNSILSVPSGGPAANTIACQAHNTGATTGSGFSVNVG